MPASVRRRDPYHARALTGRAIPKQTGELIKLIRACFLVLAVLLPTSWTIARAEDAPKDGDKPAETKKKTKKKAKKSKKKDSGDMGDMKRGDMK